MMPKLRFSEFSQEWKKLRLGDYVQSFQKRVSSETNIPIYSSSRQGLKPQAEYFADRELQNDGEYGVVPYGYITYRHMSDDNTFHFNLNDKLPEIAISKEYPVFKGKGLDDYFLISKLNYTNEFKAFAIQQKAGGTRTRLYFKKLCDWHATFPVLEEQKKIASFLSAVDKKINLLNKEHNMLHLYRTGIMQKIFRQELRFKDKDGSNFPKWENKKIGSLLSEYKCKTTLEDEWPVMTSSRSGLVLQKEYYRDNRLTERSNLGFNIIPRGYITYRSRSDDGLFFFNQNRLNTTGCISVYYPVFNFEYGDNYFYTIMFNYYKHIFRAYAVGSSQLVLSITDLKKMNFLIPSPNEQKKISELFLAMESRISANRQEINKLKSWKQGLLQQMFI
ncbi:restriction endonuclease subunit S [Citrobacter freundii]|uniref:restriction endonuclease subunit S n=1 Tax=Citrobacter freundii TaxID=546 RepID=UPI001905CDC5|nr:restriction endonuclease subunit S [Citrobacter freundii]MBJ9290771.1 restriction endonuclease subunit S [Citrobacter freundii]